MTFNSDVSPKKSALLLVFLFIKRKIKLAEINQAVCSEKVCSITGGDMGKNTYFFK